MNDPAKKNPMVAWFYLFMSVAVTAIACFAMVGGFLATFKALPALWKDANTVEQYALLAILLFQVERIVGRSMAYWFKQAKDHQPRK